jgi:integrase
MNGHVIKRAGYWRISLELGEQAALRCPTCVDRRGKGRRYWSDDDPPDACPTCGGELEELLARRQELLPAPHKYTKKKEAEKALHDELRDRERGDYVPPSDLTVRQYLEDHWIPALGSEELAESSLDVYREEVGRIVPAIGDMQLQQLTRNDVAVMAARLANEIRPTIGRPLSPATRRHLLGVLQHALDDAVTAGLLRSNPATGVKKPKVRRPEMHTWSSTELATFLRATRDDRLGPLWHLLALTGVRRGEALGLQWSDVDLEHGRLMLQRQRKAVRYAVRETQLKTDKPRPISLDTETMEIGRAHV